MTFAARYFSSRRGARREHIPRGSVSDEQRSLGEKDLPPGGLRRIWPVASLLSRSSIAADTLPPSRLATGQILRNERHRLYELGHLVSESGASEPGNVLPPRQAKLNIETPKIRRSTPQ